jgi:acyl-CoA synthetase (AMP-forming)/AMP-acid ligase II
MLMIFPFSAPGRPGYEVKARAVADHFCTYWTHCPPHAFVRKEIENVLASHPKILELAAIGVPDEKSGEVIKIFVVKKDQSLSESEILDYCHQNMTKYKIPKHVEFRKELPKSNVGKIIRRILKEEEAKKN